MIDLPITDTHVHLWDVERTTYSWLSDLPLLHETHGVEEYDDATGDAPIETIVFVECTESFDDEESREEVRWVSSLAETDERIQGIIAHASLEKGQEARPHLDWLAQNPRVKGVRRLLQDESEAFFERKDFIEGVQLLEEYGLTFDITVRAHQLPAVIDLVDQCPGVSFVLDHLGKPNIEDGLFDTWSTHLTSLAERQNVTCKLSGVLTEADPETWTPVEIRPYLEHALDCFGVDRLMFGSDWPVVRLAADYPTWLDLLDTTLHGISRSEKRELFHSTPKRIYQL